MRARPQYNLMPKDEPPTAPAAPVPSTPAAAPSPQPSARLLVERAALQGQEVAAGAALGASAGPFALLFWYRPESTPERDAVVLARGDANQLAAAPSVVHLASSNR